MKTPIPALYMRRQLQGEVIFAGGRRGDDFQLWRQGEPFLAKIPGDGDGCILALPENPFPLQV